MVAAYAFLFAHALAPAELDAAALARVVAAQNGGQAVVAIADGRTVLVDESGTADVVSADLKKRNVRLFPGPVTIAHSEILPDTAMPTVARLRQPDPVRRGRPVELPATALVGGKVTFTSEAGSRLDLAMLPKVRWGLPLVLAPAFSDTLAANDLAVSVKDLDEAEFLRSVAKAIGGRYRTDGKSQYIETSGGELRARALRGIDLTIKNPRENGENAMNLSSAEEGEEGEAPVAPQPRQERRQRGPRVSSPAAMAAQLGVARAVINGVAPRDFERFLDGQLEGISVDLAGQQAAQQALVRLLQSNATDPRALARVNSLLSTVPPRAPGSIVLGTGFSIDANLNTLDRRGNPGRSVRLRVL